MTISWFSIQASIQLVGGNTIVNYYFSVDTTSNLITGFYNYNNIGVNVLQVNALPYPIGQPPVFSLNPVDNIFNASTLLFNNNQGVNFSDTSLETILQTNTPYFNFYNDLNLPYIFWLYIIDQTGPNTDDSTIWPTNYINIQSISGPPSQVPCFKEGTQILTDQGYKSIEHLRKGHLVKTLKNGFLPIEMIGKREMIHPASPDRIKNQLYIYQKNKEIFESLVLTGCHSILVDCLTQDQVTKTMEEFGRIFETDGKLRLMAYLDDKASIYTVPGTYTIYHLALENEHYTGNYGIYANGLLVESCSKRYLKELSGMELIE